MGDGKVWRSSAFAPSHASFFALVLVAGGSRRVFEAADRRGVRGYLFGGCEVFATTLPAPQPVRQIKDAKLIEERMSALPEGIKEIVGKKFQGEFVSIERIDPQKLI